jgi:hypothetical protein
MHPDPGMRQDALAERRREMLRSTDRRLQLIQISQVRATKRVRATNAHHGIVDRNVRLRIWLLHQLTWPRWPRTATEEA